MPERLVGGPDLGRVPARGGYSAITRTDIRRMALAAVRGATGDLSEQTLIGEVPQVPRKLSMSGYALGLAKQHVKRFKRRELLVAVRSAERLQSHRGGKIGHLPSIAADIAVVFTPPASSQEELWINPRVAHAEIARQFFYRRPGLQEDAAYQMDHALARVAATNDVGLVRLTPVLTTCNGSCGSAIEKKVAGSRLGRSWAEHGYEHANVPELLKMCSAATFGQDTRGADHLVVTLMCGVYSLYGYTGISELDEAYWEKNILSFGHAHKDVFGEVY